MNPDAMRSLQCTRVISYVELPDAISYDVEATPQVVTCRGGTFTPASVTFKTFRTVNGIKEQMSDHALAYEVNGQQSGGTYTPKSTDTWPLVVKSYDDTGDERVYLGAASVSLVTETQDIRYDIVPGVSSVVRKTDGTYDPGALSLSLFRTVDGTRSEVSVAEMEQMDGRYNINGAILSPGTLASHPFDINDSLTYPLVIKFITRTAGGVTTLATATVSRIREIEGPEGPVIRVSEWEPGKYYYNGTVKAPDGVKYLDIAWTANASGTQKLFFKCEVTHTSSAATRPEAGDGKGKWTQFNDLGAVYASTIFAPRARIDFLNGQEIVFLDSAGDIYGRIGSALPSGSVMHLGGASPESATYNLDKEGNVRFGEKNKTHVEILAGSRDINIHGWLPVDSDSSHDILDTVARFTGQTVTIPSGGNDTESTTSLTALTWESSGGAVQSRSVKIGQWTDTISELAVKVPVKLTTAGTGHVNESGTPPGPPLLEDTRATSGSGGDQGTADWIPAHDKIAEISVTVKLVHKDSSGVSTVRASATRSIRSHTTNNSDAAYVNMSLDVPGAGAGEWYIELSCSGSLEYDSVHDNPPPSWQVTVGTATIWKRNIRFSSVYGKGGFYAGTSSKCHVAAISNCNPDPEGTDMKFEALSKDTGIKVENGGLFTKHNGSEWIQHPIVLFRGSIYLNGGSWAIAGHGLGNALPPNWKQLTDISGYTSFRLPFPEAWSEIIPGITTATNDKFMVQVIASHDNPAMTSGYKDTYTENNVTRGCAIIRLKFDNSSGSKRFNVVITYYPT